MKKITLVLFLVAILSFSIYFGLVKKDKKEVQNKTEEQTAVADQEEIQEISVRVDGSSYPGYFPNVTEVKKGKKVRVTFITENEESCAIAVNIAEAGVYDKILPKTGITPVEFTPTKEGEFVIYCGMNGMFNTAIKVVV